VRPTANKYRVSIIFLFVLLEFVLFWWFHRGSCFFFVLSFVEVNKERLVKIKKENKERD
jgi:hypothetical protein